jgi:acyl carrier protein
MTPEALTAWLVEKTASLLQLPVHYVDPAQPFASQGLDSMGMLELTGDLAAHLGRELPPSLIWEHPTIVALASHLTQTSSEMDELPIVPVPRDVPIPQTFAQERMWREYQVNGHDRRQIVWRLLRLTGDELDLPVLKDSVTRLMLRHEALRTTFTEAGGMPVQQIHPSPLGELEIIDLTGQEGAEQSARGIIEETVKQPIDLAVGPLARFHLFVLGKGNYLFCLLIHHIICDGESNRILIEDLGQIYQAALAGANAGISEPAPLTVQTADFATWQRQWLKEDGSAYTRHVTWWNELLGSTPPSYACAGLRWEQAPTTLDPEQCRVGRLISLKTLQKLEALSVQEGSTVANVVYTAMVLALSRHGTDARALLGSYVTDRRRPALRRLPGLYVNLIVMPMPQVPAGDFLEALHTVTEALHQIALHQDLPFEELAKARAKAGLYAPHPLMIFNYRRQAELPEFLVPGVTISGWKTATKRKRTAIPWGMNIAGVENDAGIDLHAIYDVGLYDPAKVDAMLEDLASILFTVAESFTGARTDPASFAVAP